MDSVKVFTISVLMSLVSINISANAEGFIKKEVYSFKDKNGNLVFTDRQPVKKSAYKTQTIEAANSTGSSQNNANFNNNNNQDYSRSYSNNSSEQTVRIIVEDRSAVKKKSKKTKKSVNRCKTYKRKHAYYSDKLKAGYKNSEYKKLESNRKKYRNLLFNNCETKTFAD